jgi:phage FluMu gp28-like protein
MDSIEIIRPRLTDYQKAIIYCAVRFTVTTAATKTGKTFSHLWWLFEEAGSSTKQGANYWWVAPVFSQAEIAFNRLRRFLGGSSDFKINQTKLTVEMPNGSVIHFKSAQDPDTLYGEDVHAVVFDEFTRAKEAAWIALRSTLTATKGKCKFIGNPKGKKNWGAKLAARARSGEPGYQFFKITAYDAVAAGVLDAQEIEQAKRDLPEIAFKELYEAEENEDQANPFGISFIKKCLKPLSQNPAVCYGVDLAKSHDWTVVVGLDEAGDVCFFERWQGDWGQTRRRLVEIIGYEPAYMDSTGVGDPIVEDVQRECSQVEGYHYSSMSKQKLMEGLASSIQNGEVSVLEGTMQDELESFEYIYSSRGVRYGAPEGLHDDCVNALALAKAKHKDRPTPTMWGGAHR